jgi:hypothetical protein
LELNMAKQKIKGSQFTQGQLNQMDVTAPENSVHMINHKYAHLGLSVPTAIPMGGGISDVVQTTVSHGRGRPRTTENLTVKADSSLRKEGFNQFFVHPETGELTEHIHDMEGLRQHPGFQLMVDRFIDEHHRIMNSDKKEAALDFYPNEKRQLADTGARFNANRRAKGLKEYHPDQPELAGALLRGGYSQSNSERNRDLLSERSANTGEIQNWVSRAKMENAIENDTHPLEAFGDVKLRDFTGSSIDPEGWNGEHAGVKIGTGHTIDRHQHDSAVNRDFGNIDLKLSKAGDDKRRYRVMQAALAEANARVAPHLSPAQFQSSTWTGH